MPFVKGKSGNPGGKPKELKAIQDLAKVHSPAAINTLASVCKAGKSEAARVTAAVALLDRAWGKSPQALHLSTPNGPLQTEDVSAARDLVEGRIAGIASRNGLEGDTGKPH